MSLALLGAACATPAPAEVDAGEGLRLVPETVDWRADVGQDATVAIDSSGQPSIVYLGFKQVLEEGDIPDARPLHQAPVPNVLQANIEGSEDSPFWNILPVSWHRVQFEFPTGDELLQTTAADGTAQAPAPNASANSAIDDEGVIHVVWTDSEGVKYANDAQGEFAPVAVAAAPDAFGASIAVGEGGQPWIAYYDGDDVILVTEGVRGWISQSVGRVFAPSDQAPRTRVAIDAQGRPSVAFSDGASPAVATWDPVSFVMDANALRDLATEDKAALAPVISVIAVGDGGFGISLAYDKDGGAHVAYYDQDGAVRAAHAAASTDGSLNFDQPVEVAPGAEGADDAYDTHEAQARQGTGIAVDDQGVGYLTWYDVASNSVKMSMHEGEEMKAMPVPSSANGALPSIAASADGKTVWMAWYNSSSENLLAAQLTDAKEITIAAVSPSPVVTAPAPPAPKPECEPPTLDLSAPGGAVTTGFAETCLAAEADKPFTITFDNQDGGVPHNVAVYESDTSTDAIAATEVAPGVVTQTLDVDPLKAGDFFYKCDVHPNMNGTLVIV